MKHRLDKYFVYSENVCTMHRTPLKCIINPLLRILQFWDDKPYVIASNCKKLSNNKITFISYAFMKVWYKRR